MAAAVEMTDIVPRDDDSAGREGAQTAVRLNPMRQMDRDLAAARSTTMDLRDPVSGGSVLWPGNKVAFFFCLSMGLLVGLIVVSIEKGAAPVATKEIVASDAHGIGLGPSRFR